jgi:hypothetical protein
MIRTGPTGGIAVALGGFPGVVVVLDGTTGGETWRLPTPHATAEIDSAGDVLAIPLDGEPGIVVAKLAGTNGVERWRARIADESDGIAPILVADAAGDVIVATSRRTGDATWTPLVTKLSGVDGRLRWTWTPTLGQRGYLAGVTVDADGDVIVGGGIDNRWGGTDLLVAKLDGGTGAERRSPGARRCRRAVVRAASSAFVDRLRARQRRATKPGRGRDPVRSGARARMLLATACTDDLVSAFPMCADTVDGLVAADGTSGCVLAQVDLAVDAAYAAEFTKRSDPDARACRDTVAAASARFARSLLVVASICRDRIDMGALVALPTECPAADGALQRHVEVARRRLRTRLEVACDPAALPSAGACAASLDGLAVAGADAGCLVVAHRDAVAALLAGVLGP